jgi:hypothetical protein
MQNITYAVIQTFGASFVLDSYCTVLDSYSTVLDSYSTVLDSYSTVMDSYSKVFLKVTQLNYITVQYV